MVAWLFSLTPFNVYGSFKVPIMGSLVTQYTEFRRDWPIACKENRMYISIFYVSHAFIMASARKWIYKEDFVT